MALPGLARGIVYLKKLLTCISAPRHPLTLFNVATGHPEKGVKRVKMKSQILLNSKKLYHLGAIGIPRAKGQK